VSAEPYTAWRAHHDRRQALESALWQVLALHQPNDVVAPACTSCADDSSWSGMAAWPCETARIARGVLLDGG
jgi:hypothetical protein